MRAPGPGLFAASLALIVSACASSDVQPLLPPDNERVSRPSNSSVLFPGEQSYSVYEAPIWLLPQF